MAKAKERKPSTFSVKCWAGTPHELEVDVKKTPSSCKTFLRGRALARLRWAQRFNHEMAKQLAVAMEEIDSLNLTDAKVGEQFEWTAKDDYTGVKLVFGCEVISK